MAHYNREHAPNRKYLAPELTIEAMYADFQIKNPHFKCCKEVYRKEIARMNIGFFEAHAEKCSDCV